MISPEMQLYTNLPSARILSALASEMPLTNKRFFFGVKATLSIVW